MKNLFDAVIVEEVNERMAHLRPDSERLWGKMTTAQALAHCSAAMQDAVGLKFPPRRFTGRLTPVEWAAMMYQHPAHHLRQFGV